MSVFFYSGIRVNKKKWYIAAICSWRELSKLDIQGKGGWRWVNFSTNKFNMIYFGGICYNLQHTSLIIFVVRAKNNPTINFLRKYPIM